MKVKLCQLISQEGDSDEILCTCTIAAENEQEIADYRSQCGGDILLCQTEEIMTITHKDGARFRVILLPEYKLEAKKDAQ